MNNNNKRIIIATGGTGGHVFPAYSLAKHFLADKVNVELISDKRGMKYLKNYQDLKITQITSTTILKNNIFEPSRYIEEAIALDVNTGRDVYAIYLITFVDKDLNPSP